MTFLRNNFKYIFVFLISCLILIYFGFFINVCDSISSYGFSYSIAKGLIPYRDFNMVITPLHSFIMSIGLVLFSHNNIVFLIEHALVITFSFYFLYKTFGSSAWLFIAFMCFPSFIAFCPTYNYFCFFLVTIVLFLEKNNNDDYLIGFILGLLILTKQSIGFCLLIPSVIYYIKSRDKLLKRFFGMLIPCTMFFVYLFITNSFFQFIDLCFLGLFDFAEKNTIALNSYFYLSILLFIISIIYVIKNKKDITGWYVLFSFSVMLPIFNYYHFYVYFMFISLLIISIFQKKNVKDFYVIGFSVCICICSIMSNFFLSGVYKKAEVFTFKNFNYYFYFSEKRKYLEILDGLYNKYRAIGNTVMISSDSIYVHIMNEDETSYFTILNEGNHGYNGSNKMIDKIDKMKKTYFIIDLLEVDNQISVSQFDLKVVNYIRKNAKFIEGDDEYVVYYKE